MTRREKRRRFSQWLGELFAAKAAAVGPRRTIRVEPLETRQLLSADGFLPLLGSGSDADYGQPDVGGSLIGEGELVAEGEDTNDLVAFAKALADSGTRFFGAAWCPFCNDQKALFEDGYKYLPFIEVANPDRTPNQIGIDEGITQYPTWEFPDSTRVTGVQSLATLAQRAGVAIPQSSTPSLSQIPNLNVAIGSPQHVAVDAYDPNGDPLTISVTSSDPSLLTAEVLSGNRSLQLATNFGDMVFELFEDKASAPSGRVIQLANDGFYDGVTFHRVINNFVIQGGDPTGTGSGGSTLGDFDDQFHLDLQHNSTGMLSYAKSSDDTNDSQFFITEGPQRFLDFNHSVFGKLVEGETVREAISNTATNASDKPINNVVIQTASVFNDTENGVIMLKPTGSGTGPVTITVTVADNEGNSTSQSFVATVVQDTANGAPFLNPIPTVQTAVNTPVTVNLTSQDAEGDAPIYSVQKLGSENFTVSVDSSTGVATVTPGAGFVGEAKFRATVRQATAPTTSSPDDNQVVTVIVAQSVPTGLDLQAASDSGSSSTDNITSAQSLVFSVSGTTAGATVEIRSGGTVLGSTTATGATTQVTVSDVSGLGQGSSLFVATQTSGGQTSGESPSLAVVLDSTAPAIADTSSVPASAVVDQQLSVNVQHAEEGQGLTYSLVSAPAGMSIGAQDGVFTWTPTSAQLGAQTVTLRLTDLAGNETNQDITLNVIETPLVRFTLGVVSLSGAPITTVAAGETFKVQLFAQDLRPGVDAIGVFSAYADLLFDSNVIEPIATNPVTHSAPYTNGKKGSVATSGLIDELGGFSASTDPLDGDPHLVAEVTFLAKAAGNPNLRTESADISPSDDVLVFGDTTAVPLTRIDYGASSFAVGANFELLDDSFNFDEDSGAHTLNVLSNDTVTGGAVLTIAAVTTPNGGGTVTIASDGKSLNYTSAADFNGAESFTYTAQNQSGVQLTATVTVQVTDINDPPVALNDTFTVFRNSTQNVLEVLSNDTKGADESSNEALVISAVGSGSAGGTVVVGPSGLTLRYTPANGFQGTETFTYTLSDGRGGSDTGTVSVSVNLSNPPPTPQNDSFTVLEDAAEASYDVLANDTTDDSSETLSISAVGSPNFGGIAAVASDGLSILYRPAPNFNGTEIFTYTLRDSGGATANGLVTFTVTPVNDPPHAINDDFNVLAGDPTTTLDVLQNDPNVDSGETYQITAVSQPPAGSGTVTIASNAAHLIYTPPSSTFEGNFSFTYTIGDGSGLTDTATVNLDVRDFVPRSIGGTVHYSNANGVTGAPFFGQELLLSGTDVTGNPVALAQRVAPDGSFAFDNLAPGQYTLNRPALAFLHDSGSSVAINSSATDGDMVSDLVVSGGLRPEFFDIRDFLGSSSRGSLMVAVNADGSQNWLSARGDWTQLSQITANLDTGTNAVAISAVNSNQENLSGTAPLSNPSRAYIVGRNAATRLIKVVGNSSDVGLTAVAASSLTAEGEGGDPQAIPAVDAGLSVPRIESVRTGAPAGTPTPVNALSPTEAIRQLLGSTQSLSTDVAMSSDAVDAAMTSVLPSLEVKLAGDLEHDLTTDADDFLAAGDSLLADF